MNALAAGFADHTETLHIILHTRSDKSRNIRDHWSWGVLGADRRSRDQHLSFCVLFNGSLKLIGCKWAGPYQPHASAGGLSALSVYGSVWVSWWDFGTGYGPPHPGRAHGGWWLALPCCSRVIAQERAPDQRKSSLCCLCVLDSRVGSILRCSRHIFRSFFGYFVCMPATAGGPWGRNTIRQTDRQVCFNDQGDRPTIACWNDVYLARCACL